VDTHIEAEEYIKVGRSANKRMTDPGEAANRGFGEVIEEGGRILP